MSASRALVLGGGGVTGIAWELGVVAAVAEAGVDLVDADIVIGTSAGAAVAAQITAGTALEALLEAQRRPADESAELQPNLDLDLLIEIFTLMNNQALTETERLLSVGRRAMAADTVDEATRRRVIEARLPCHRWPDQRLQITAVDAEAGRLVAFDRTSGVSLVDAVAASCAVPGIWPLVTIDGRRYFDGGVGSPTNADLASGHSTAVILAPLDRSMTPRLDDEVARLEAEGTSVTVVEVDQGAIEAIGPNPLDITRRAEAVEAGLRQGAQIVDDLARVWTGAR